EMLFRSIVDRGVCKRRNLSPKYNLSSLLDGYQCARHDEHISYGNLGVVFSTAPGLQGVLAVANEGVLKLYNTENRQSPLLKEWLAHDNGNAIFDLAWVPGEASLVSDQMAKLWDVTSGELLGSFKGHQCSLKSVAFTQQEKAVFCTGGRDGNIMVWDTRCSKKDGFYRQVKQISGAHNKMDRNTPSKTKKRPGTRGMEPSVDSKQSVTVVLFQDEHTLISSGADNQDVGPLGKNYTAYHHDPIPLQVYLYPGTSIRKLGYSGLVLDSTGSDLFSNLAVFGSHLNSSFYVKSTVSPDNQFLASGSSDHHTYIWKISDPKQPPMMLQGHSQQVTSIAWCPTDFTKIASSSDDNTVRIWRLDRGTDGAKSSVGEANLVGWYLKFYILPLNQVECTPAKSPWPGGLGALASPQPASCTPTGADLPLTSSTTAASPLQAQGAKATLICQKTPSFIRNWLARTPGKQVTPPLRKVLSPCPQSPVPTLPSERMAKRQLENGDSGAAGGCEGSGECDCITGLYPAAKRSRGLAGVSEAWGKADFQVEDQRPVPATQADKENSSPEGSDWLSAMSQKLRKGVGNPSSTPRSPSAPKRQDGRIPTSPVYTRS
uniref:Denticleless E3 ubiquitin protein ligase homolog (Drosophila) n=1 Tax=Hucho hucho TaxID=62062 RepID=A0A4W5P075_9TELE